MAYMDYMDLVICCLRKAVEITLTGRCQAIICTNAGILSIGHFTEKFFSEMLIEIQTFIFKKIHLKMSSPKWQPSCPGLIVLTDWPLVVPCNIMEIIWLVPTSTTRFASKMG